MLCHVKQKAYYNTWHFAVQITWHLVGMCWCWRPFRACTDNGIDRHAKKASLNESNLSLLKVSHISQQHQSSLFIIIKIKGNASWTSQFYHSPILVFFLDFSVELPKPSLFINLHHDYLHVFHFLHDHSFLASTKHSGFFYGMFGPFHKVGPELTVINRVVWRLLQ